MSDLSIRGIVSELIAVGNKLSSEKPTETANSSASTPIKVESLSRESLKNIVVPNLSTLSRIRSKSLAESIPLHSSVRETTWQIDLRENLVENEVISPYRRLKFAIIFCFVDN